MCGRRGDNPVPSPRRGQGVRGSERGLLGHLGPGRARAGRRLGTATVASGFIVGKRHRRIRRHAGNTSGSGDGVGDAAGWVALGGGAGPVVGGCGHGPAAAAGDRQGRQGTARAGGCGVLHRGGGVSAVGAPTGAGDTAVFRGAARPDYRRAGQRGRAAQPVSLPPGALRRNPGASAPAAPHLRHRISLGGNRSARVAGVDGHASPETTARYVHLSVEQLAAEYGAARATLAGAPR